MVTDTPSGERMSGAWKQLRGKLREKWGDITDDELDRLKGKKDQIAGLIERRTGEQRAEIERDIDRLTRETGWAW